MKSEVKLKFPGERLDYPCSHEALSILYWHSYGRWPSIFQFTAGRRETKGFIEFFREQEFETLAIHATSFMADRVRQETESENDLAQAIFGSDEDSGHAFWCKKRAIFVHAWSGAFNFICDVSQEKEIRRLITACKARFPFKNLDKHMINFLCESHGSLQLRGVELGRVKRFNLLDNYGEDFARVDKLVRNFINVKGTGLGIFHGPPGTGKSTYIHYLLGKSSEGSKMIYLPSHMASVIANPNFIQFMLTQGMDSVLIVEDAEQILLQRSGNDNPSCSNLLNLTDGLLGKALNCRVLCTFNVAKAQLDKALLRKGRLKIDHEFKPLSITSANKLLRKLRKKITAKEPMTLAEIYNVEVDPHCGVERSEQQMGFAA